MMMIETYLNGGVYTEEIRDRVIGMIDYCTEQILALHGDAINRSLMTEEEIAWVDNYHAWVRETLVPLLDDETAEFVRQETMPL